jgi:uncharacterized membrane protein YfcA
MFALERPANGLIGGLTGPGGIAKLLGAPKDAQRATFQPVTFATFAMIAVAFALGTITIETLKLYTFALPVLIVGIWCGLRLYGKLDDAAFRKMVLVLLPTAVFRSSFRSGCSDSRRRKGTEWR